MRRALPVLLLVASALLCALAAEASLRLLGAKPTGAVVNPNFRADAESGWAEPHPTLGWRNRAGVARSVEPGHARMRFWEHGRRASRPEAEEPRSDGALVLLTGCSFTQGYGIADEETLAWRLSGCFPDARFENVGTGGYGTLQAWLSLGIATEAAPRLARPEIVLYGLLAAHAERNAAGFEWIRSLTNQRGERVDPPRGRIENGALAIEPFRAIPGWPGEGRSALLTRLHDAALRFATRRRDTQGPEITRRVLGRFAADAAARGARFAVVLLDWSNDRDADEEALLRGVRDDGLEVIDCGVALDETSARYRTGGDWGHPSGFVNARWSECVAAWLRDYGGPAFARESGECRAAQ